MQSINLQVKHLLLCNIVKANSIEVVPRKGQLDKVNSYHLPIFSSENKIWPH